MYLMCTPLTHTALFRCSYDPGYTFHRSHDETNEEKHSTREDKSLTKHASTKKPCRSHTYRSGKRNRKPHVPGRVQHIFCHILLIESYPANYRPEKNNDGRHNGKQYLENDRECRPREESTPNYRNERQSPKQKDNPTDNSDRFLFFPSNSDFLSGLTKGPIG